MIKAAASENLFIALSDGTRLRLLALIGDGEASVGYLSDMLGQSQPKVSRHLAYLRGAGLVTTRRDGKRVFYRIQFPGDPFAERILAAAIEWAGGTVTTIRPTDESAERFQQQENGWDDDYEREEIEIYLL